MNAPATVESFALCPFPADTVRRFRTGTDDGGQPVLRIAHAEGGEPLRDQYRRALPGEPILLGAYSPFSLHNPYREMGPVFVSAVLPAPMRREIGDYFRSTTVLRAYNADQQTQAATLVAPGRIEAQLERYFADPEVWFVDARFAAYGCFACRYVRSPSSAHSS